MKRCVKCWMPDTRPGSIFDGDVCQACINYAHRSTTNWQERLTDLGYICTRSKRPGNLYDCIIPVSGGKDSYTLCKVMVEDMGMKPLLVTVTDSFTHTETGKHNLRNLIERYKLNHWQYTINHDLFKRATRGAFEETGEPLKFVEYAIYTIPFILAQRLGINLVVFGENSAYEYGSTAKDSWDAGIAIENMVRKIESEIPKWEKWGISKNEIESIIPNMKVGKPTVLFMSYFMPWSSLSNLKIAKDRGFQDLNDTKEWDREGTCEQSEQIDSVGYMVHLYMKYPKFGFQRATDIASRRVREGVMSLEEAKKIMDEIDPWLDERSRKDFCNTLGYTDDEFWKIAKRFDKMGVLG